MPPTTSFVAVTIASNSGENINIDRHHGTNCSILSSHSTDTGKPKGKKVIKKATKALQIMQS